MSNRLSISVPDFLFQQIEEATKGTDNKSAYLAECIRVGLRELNKPKGR